jgi:type IV pilus assembly protein PilV
VAGISLIEMLIALLVLSFGLLGMAGLQAYSLRNNNSAYHRSQATALGYEAIDLMRANAPQAVGVVGPPAVARQNYDIAYGALPSGTTRPALDVIAWKNRVTAALPAGDGRIDCDPATRICTVGVRWDDSRGAAPVQEFTASSRL